MKYGIVVVWEGPTGDAFSDEAYVSTVTEMISNSLLDLNTALKKANMPTTKFNLFRESNGALTKTHVKK